MHKTVKIINKLSKRLLVYILLCSLLLSVCSTLLQLYASFNNELDDLNDRFKNIQTSYLPSIATSLWDFNEYLVNQQIQGIVDLPDVHYVKVVTDLGKEYTFGEQNIAIDKSVEYPVFYRSKRVGKLLVYANYQDIYQHTQKQAGFIIATEFIKIFIVTFLFLLIVHQIITRHLFQIINYTRELALDSVDYELALKGKRTEKNELDDLVDGINNMRVSLKDEIIKLEAAEDALLALNGELEVKVHDRTVSLSNSNNDLQKSLDDLTLAKDQLVQSEKMASLGQLVAGVAHEVNTPLGICITSITALRDRVDGLLSAIDDNKLTKSFLLENLHLLNEYQQITERSLNKSVDLIRSFKSVAVEQHTDSEVKINLGVHVNDIINTVKVMFKRKKYHIEVKVDPEFSLVTYPSAWNQILTNFLMNSHLHGFEEQNEGDISLEFSHSNDYLTLIYKDNGKGISEDVIHRIFDPFVTTKRGQGGSGLGLNIVYNLVHTKLGGSIKCLPVEQGCSFQVKVPISHTSVAKVSA